MGEDVAFERQALISERQTLIEAGERGKKRLEIGNIQTHIATLAKNRKR